MTLPSERSKALLATAEFLQELRSGFDTSSSIHAKVISVLRHFPNAVTFL